MGHKLLDSFRFAIFLDCLIFKISTFRHGKHTKQKKVVGVIEGRSTYVVSRPPCRGDLCFGERASLGGRHYLDGGPFTKRRSTTPRLVCPDRCAIVYHSQLVGAFSRSLKTRNVGDTGTEVERARTGRSVRVE